MNLEHLTVYTEMLKKLAPKPQHIVCCSASLQDLKKLLGAENQERHFPGFQGIPIYVDEEVPRHMIELRPGWTPEQYAEMTKPRNVLRRILERDLGENFTEEIFEKAAKLLGEEDPPQEPDLCRNCDKPVDLSKDGYFAGGDVHHYKCEEES